MYKDTITHRYWYHHVYSIDFAFLRGFQLDWTRISPPSLRFDVCWYWRTRFLAVKILPSSLAQETCGIRDTSRKNGHHDITWHWKGWWKLLEGNSNQGPSKLGVILYTYRWWPEVWWNDAGHLYKPSLATGTRTGKKGASEGISFGTWTICRCSSYWNNTGILHMQSDETWWNPRIYMTLLHAVLFCFMETKCVSPFFIIIINIIIIIIIIIKLCSMNYVCTFKER